jgi:F0F1-type ATP synthase assembly protein I
LSFVVVVAFIVSISTLLPSGTVEITSRGPLKWEIPARMVTATAVVLLITEGATILGPHLSGLLTTFPAYTAVLVVFTHRFDGAAASSLFLRGVVTGTLSSAVFFFLLASFIMQLGLSIAFGLALLAAMTLQYLLFCYLSKGHG